MGMGMVIAVSAESAQPVCEWLNERLPGSRLVGEVNSNARVVTHSDPEVVFSHY